MNTRANRTVPSDAQTGKDRHAVVLGGSLAGLLAARILADHFERVTLIERDAYVDTTAVRKGIPQANHVHRTVLLRVFNLLLPPSALFRRSVLFRVVSQAIKPAGARDVAPKRPRQALYDVERRYGRETS